MLRILTIIESAAVKSSVSAILQKLKTKEIPSLRKYSGFLKSIQYEPHAIIVEVPGIDPEAIKLLQLIGKNSATEDIPIIAFGPAIEEAQKKLIRRCGADAYFTTPLDFKKLFTKLNALLQEYSEKIKKDAGVSLDELSKSDIAFILNPQEPLSKKIDLMERHVSELLAFPTTVASVLKLTQDSHSSADQLSKVIESDSEVSAEILKLANSVYYATRNGKVNSFKDAIVRIGFEQAKKTVMSMSVLNSVNSTNHDVGFNHAEFWFHSLAVAVISEKLAQKSGLVAPGEAYIFGLLHELGVLLYNEYFNPLFLNILDKSTERGQPFITYQLDSLKLSHNDLQARLFGRWNFSREFVEACKALNGDCFSEGAVQATPLATIAMVADTIAHSLAIGRATDCSVGEVPEAILQRLSITEELGDSFVNDIYRSINMYNSLLHIDSREYPLAQSRMEGSDEITLVVDSRATWNPVREYLLRQGYTLIKAKNEEEFLRSLSEAENTFFVFSSLRKEGLATIEKCKNHRGIIFDSNFVISDPIAPEEVVIASYPVDLRNVDMVLHSFVEASSTIHTDENKTLLPTKVIRQNNVLIGHSLMSVVMSLRSILSKRDFARIEIADDGNKVANMARTSQNDIALFLIDHSLVGLDSLEAIKQIKALNRHQRGQFIILYKSGTLTDRDREKYQFFGVKNFIDYEKELPSLERILD